MAQARGVVTEIQAVGSSLKLAHIDWGSHDMPGKVNVANLAIKGANRRFCNVD